MQLKCQLDKQRKKMTSSDKPIDFDQSEPIPLDPIILRARDELLEKYSDKSFEEQITFYKAVIEGEKIVWQG